MPVTTHNLRTSLMTHSNPICPSPEFTDAIRAISKLNDKAGRYDYLTPFEITVVRELLRGRPRGTCTAPSIFGLYWKLIEDGKKFGIRFRRSVKKGHIPHLVFGVDETSGTKKYMHRPPVVIAASKEGSAANDGANREAA